MKKMQWMIAGIIIVAAIALVSFLLFRFLYENERAASIYTAAGTLVLAGATIILALFTLLSVRNADEREKSHREEELAREKRDRKEKLLNEIIGWAEDVANCQIGVDYQAVLKANEDPNIDRTLTHIQIDEWCIRLQARLTKGSYIGGVAKIFSEDIQGNIKVLIDDLNNFINSLFLCSNNRMRGLSHEEYEKHWGNSMEFSRVMDLSAQKVIEAATKIKMEMLVKPQDA